MFGGNGGDTNVLTYNTKSNIWSILPVKIPFAFVSGCSTVIGDCKVLLIASTGTTAVFDAVSETFEDSSKFPNIGTSSTHCAATLGKVNNEIGVMVFSG